MTVQVVDQVRGPGLGASMAAACLGVSPYLSPIGAWLRLKGRTPDTAGPQAEWGNILEPVVRGYYAARHGLSVGDERSPTILVPTHSMYRADLPWLRATPDGIVREWVTPPSAWTPSDDGPVPSPPYWRNRHLVQVKTCDQRLRWHWGLNPRTPSAPPHYRIQAVVEMAVTGQPMTLTGAELEAAAVLLSGRGLSYEQIALRCRSSVAVVRRVLGAARKRAARAQVTA